MFKRKVVDRNEENDDINYHGINIDEDNDVAYDNTNSNRAGPSNLSRWKYIIGALYRYRGIVWAVISVCVSTGCSLCIKLLAGKVAASQILVFRGFAQVLFSLPYLVFYSVSLCYPFKIFKPILSRGIAGCLSSFLAYFAVQSLPVATAKALLSSFPLFTGIFARMFLGERCSVGIVFFALLTVMAVTLVAQPPFIFGGSDVSTGNLAGILGAIFGAAAMALSQITLRFTQILRIDGFVIIFYYGITAMFCGGIVSVVLGEWANPQCGIDRGLIIGLATTGFMEQISLTLALKSEPALVVSIIRTNEVFLFFALDFFMFDIVPNAWTIIGMILVVGSSIGMIVSVNREKQRSLEEERAYTENADNHQEVTTLRSEKESFC